MIYSQKDGQVGANTYWSFRFAFGSKARYHFTNQQQAVNFLLSIGLQKFYSVLCFCAFYSLDDSY